MVHLVGAYIVSRQCAIDMINYFDCLGQKIGLPVDLWLCEVARKLDLDVYWAEPTIVQQGLLKQENSKVRLQTNEIILNYKF